MHHPVTALRPTHALLCLALAALLTGCGTRGSGVRATQTRPVAPFTAVTLACAADVHITLGEPVSVTVTTDDNLLAEILTQTRGDTLTIDSHGGYTTRLGVRVDVTAPDLKAVTLNGSGDVHLQTLAREHFTGRLNGSGDLFVRGTVDHLEASVHGSGDADLSELRAQAATARFKGSGELRLHTTASLQAEISGSGDLTARGTADRLEVAVRGSGDANLSELHAREARASVTGSGDIRLHATTSLVAEVTGSGGIRYAGSPTVDRRVTGSGDITAAR